MRVCHIVPSLEKRHGGPSVSVPALAHTIAHAKQPVELFTTARVPTAEISIGTLRKQSFARGWPRALCVSSGLRRALRASEADVFHHHSLWLRTLHYAHGAAKSSGAKFVISPRGMMSEWAWNHHRFRKQLANILVHPGALAGADGWHATSAGEADEIRRLGFTQPVCVAPNGVLEPESDQLRTAAVIWQKECPMLADRPVALFYSRFHRKKRLRELFDLWISASRKDWLLLLVGLPEDHSVAEVQGWINIAGAADRVAVFDGSNMPPPYAVASLFLLPSHSENFGLVVAEAMAAGLPVLVTDGTPWAEVNRERRGWCVPWNTYGSTLTTALAEGEARLEDRGKRAKEWVLQNYSWEKSAAMLAAFYAQLRGASS